MANICPLILARDGSNDDLWKERVERVSYRFDADLLAARSLRGRHAVTQRQYTPGEPHLGGLLDPKPCMAGAAHFPGQPDLAKTATPTSTALFRKLDVTAASTARSAAGSFTTMPPRC